MDNTDNKGSRAETLLTQDAILPGIIKERHLVIGAGGSTGDLIYSNTTGGFTNLAIGKSYQVLQSVSGVPAWGARILGTQSYTPAGAGTATLDLNYNDHVITMPAGNITIATSNGTTNEWFIVEIIQDGVGSRTVTWFTTIKWVGGTAPTLTTTASKKDTFVFKVTGTGTYDGYIAGQNI